MPGISEQITSVPSTLADGAPTAPGTGRSTLLWTLGVPGSLLPLSLPLSPHSPECSSPRLLPVRLLFMLQVSDHLLSLVALSMSDWVLIVAPTLP